jgi:hypothetical protein
MPFTEPYKPQDQIELVRKVGRLAHIILDIRTEYERRPRADLLAQLLNRIGEMEAVRAEIAAHLAPPADDGAGPTPQPAGSEAHGA